MVFASQYIRLAPGTDTWSSVESFAPFIVLVCIGAIAYVISFLPTRRHWKRKVLGKSDYRKRGSNEEVSDPKWQLEFVSRVAFDRQPILNKAEAPLLVLLEEVIRDLNCGLRVMAQTSMGEIFRPRQGSASRHDCNLAFRSINSKRLDFVIVDRCGLPVLVVEYQGAGHYREQSFMRDAVKREVVRKANVTFLEIPAKYRRQKIYEELCALLRQKNVATTRRRVDRFEGTRSAVAKTAGEKH